jgi:hypothetical protein
MDLEFIRADIQQRCRQISRQRREILDLQRAGISTRSAEELLVRMLAKVDEPCVERETHASFKEKAAQIPFQLAGRRSSPIPWCAEPWNGVP